MFEEQNILLKPENRLYQKIGELEIDSNDILLEFTSIDKNIHDSITVLFNGDSSKPDWDGSSEKGVQIGGTKLPVGVYFFIVNFNDGVKKPLQGRVYLSR